MRMHDFVVTILGAPSTFEVVNGVTETRGYNVRLTEEQKDYVRSTAPWIPDDGIFRLNPGKQLQLCGVVAVDMATDKRVWTVKASSLKWL